MAEGLYNAEGYDSEDENGMFFDQNDLANRLWNAGEEGEMDENNVSFD